MAVGKITRRKICSIPNCGGDSIMDKEDIHLCKKHVDTMHFFIWALDHLTLNKEKKTDSGLILP